MKYAISSLNPTINDWSGQINFIRHIIDSAQKASVKLLVLPELCIGAPDAMDLFLRPQYAMYAEQCLAEISPLTAGITLICGSILKHNDKLYNVAAVFHDGMLIAIVPKQYPDKHLDEERWFARWDYSRPQELHAGAIFGAWKQNTIEGLENLYVCTGCLLDDPSVPENSICVEINNRSFAMNRFRNDLEKHIALSAERHLTLLRTNILGSDDGTHIYDGGGYILQNGHIIALSPRFSFQDYVLTTSEDAPLGDAFDPTLSQFQKAGSCPKNERDYAFSELELALCLGLHDYMRRSHTQRFCMALSGGRDSAMIAVILGRLNAILHQDDSPETCRNAMKDFLFCAYLPNAAHSTSGTQKAAVALAEHFGFECPVIPIEDLAGATRSIIENTLGRTLSWEQDDLTLQNVQARTRSSIIWMLANAHNAMLLTTGNLSEAAVGYTTMDGDSSGCLDPIGDIPKTLVSSWLEWARIFHNIPALDYVFAQPPSAELRPAETKQADEKDLMPYPVLDAYIEWFLVLNKSPKEIFALAKSNLTEYYTSNDDIRRDIQRFIGLVTRSQWKRTRLANSFIVMPYDLAPNTGLQWPCLQDAFTKAVSEL